MKILSWNCNMAFRNKSTILEDFCPDIAIIQECENEEVLKFKKSKITYTNYIWHGKNKNKGLGIMTFNGFKAELLEHNKELEYILPIRIYKNKINFFILAVRTQFVNKNIYESYVVQAAKSFKYYKKLLQKEKILIIGDFNSNTIWDNDSPKEYNHSQMVDILKKEKIISAYHRISQENHGKEKTPTLYFTKNKEKPYHIDYFFIKENLFTKIKSFNIGKYENYINLSDHMPLFITMKKSFLQN